MKPAERWKQTEKDRVRRLLMDRMGPGKVKDDELVRITYASDISPIAPRRPSLVVFPENREDVATVLQTANENKIPVTVMSGGVNVVGACIPPEGGIVIDLRRMDRIIEINTDSGYVVVEPGANFGRVTAALADKGYRCSIPMAMGRENGLRIYSSLSAKGYNKPRPACGRTMNSQAFRCVRK